MLAGREDPPAERDTDEPSRLALVLTDDGPPISLDERVTSLFTVVRELLRLVGPLELLLLVVPL